MHRAWATNHGTVGLTQPSRHRKYQGQMCWQELLCQRLEQQINLKTYHPLADAPVISHHPPRGRLLLEDLCFVPYLATAAR